TRLSDLGNALMDRIAWRHLGENEVAVSIDYREQVVEVVCHASCEPADKFHFLRMPQLLGKPRALLFGAFALRDVARDSEESYDCAVVVQHGTFGGQDRDAPTGYQN